MKNDNKNNKKYIDADEGIKVVRKTLSSEVENGIVIAAYTDKNGSLADSVFYAKGDPFSALAMMTTWMIKILDEYGISLDKYIHSFQLFSDKRKNK